MAATALPGMPSAGQAAGGDILALWAEATGRRLRLAVTGVPGEPGSSDASRASAILARA